MIRCVKHDHIFSQTSNNHFKSIEPCELCLKESRRNKFSYGIIGFNQKLNDKFGDVFDLKECIYINAKNPVTIKCKVCEGRFTSEPYIILSGKGCPNCRLIEHKQHYSTKMLKKINDFVSKLGGKCISKTYVNNLENLHFQCAHGHIFKESWSDIQHAMRWCKECSPNRYIGETLTRMILEHLLRTDMPSSYLTNMDGLQLDGYSSKRKVAFEYQGYQHYSSDSHFHGNKNDFNNQLARDLYKRRLCLKHGMTLIVVKEFQNITKSRIPLFVRQVTDLLVAEGIEYNTAEFTPDLVKLYRGRESELYARAKMQTKKLGFQIEEYIGSESDYNITCQKGHLFTRKLSVASRGNIACPVCKKMDKFRLLKKAVESRGGSLHHDRLNSKQLQGIYHWTCVKGHHNTTKGQYLKNGSWCPKCQYAPSIDHDHFVKIASDNSLTTNEKLKLLKMSATRFYSNLKLLGIKNIHKDQDRSLQDISGKSKGKVLQLDPITFNVVRSFQHLEAIRKETNGLIKPEGVRQQMKKGRPAYGFYWVRENDYLVFLKQHKPFGIL